MINNNISGHVELSKGLTLGNKAGRQEATSHPIISCLIDKADRAPFQKRLEFPPYLIEGFRL